MKSFKSLLVSQNGQPEHLVLNSERSEQLTESNLRLVQNVDQVIVSMSQVDLVQNGRIESTPQISFCSPWGILNAAQAQHHFKSQYRMRIHQHPPPHPLMRFSRLDKYVSALPFIFVHEECRVGGADGSSYSSGYSLERLVENLNLQIASPVCMKGTIPIIPKFRQCRQTHDGIEGWSDLQRTFRTQPGETAIWDCNSNTTRKGRDKGMNVSQMRMLPDTALYYEGSTGQKE